MLLTFQEIIDLAIITAAVGFIFSDIFREPAQQGADPVKEYLRGRRLFNWANFKFAAIVTAPAIILHEFGHKFVALAFGVQSTFHAAYTWLGIGIVLKLLSPGFIFFVPAYVSFPSAGLTNIQLALIAFAGPAVNLMLFLSAWLTWKRVKNSRLRAALHLTKQVNLFLFIFNMLPIPPFDGSQVFSRLLAVI